MATPRGIFTVPISVGSGEQQMNSASVPTSAGVMLISLQGASMIWTDQPTTLASPLTGSSFDISAAPADGPFYCLNPKQFRWRDIGAAGFITFAFYEGSPDTFGL